jgi:hypothetical protein
MGNPKRGPVVGVSRWRNRGEHIGTARHGGKRTMGTTARHGADPAAVACRAGERGVSARPLDAGHRGTNYFLQNGFDGYTPKQRRRAQKKARQAYVRNPTRATGSPEAGVSL